MSRREYDWLYCETIPKEKRLDDCVTLLINRGWEIISITNRSDGMVTYHFILEMNL